MKKNYIDPIKRASDATNKGIHLRNAKKIYETEWDVFRKKIKQEELRKSHWEDCIKKLRRKFRQQFKGKQWETLYIEWLSKGYTSSGIDKKVYSHMKYTIQYKGMKFTRNFSPRCINDVIKEGVKTVSILTAWEGMQDK